MALRSHERSCPHSNTARRGLTIVALLTGLSISLLLYDVATGLKAAQVTAACSNTTGVDNKAPCPEGPVTTSTLAQADRVDRPHAPATMRFRCVPLDKAAIYTIDVDIAGSTVGYSAELRGIVGHWGPFAAAINGETVSWDQSAEPVAGAGSTHSHWMIERSSGHMRIESERPGETDIQRNIICKRR